MPESPTPTASRSSGHFFRVPVHYMRWFLAAYYFLAIVWGVRCSYLWQASPLDFLFPVALLLLLLSWVLVDARRRGQPIPLFSRNWFILFGQYLIPMYFLARRGWRGALWALLHVLLWVLLAFITMDLAAMLIVGERWWRGG